MATELLPSLAGVPFTASVDTIMASSDSEHEEDHQQLPSNQERQLWLASEDKVKQITPLNGMVYCKETRTK